MTANTDSIPAWDSYGVIPAHNRDEPASHDRSPYNVSLLGLAERFGITKDRRRLLTGLLDFRSELHKACITRGFQWINGSFVENVEETVGRSPNDVDVVTFFHIPDGHSQKSLVQAFPVLFDNETVKSRYAVDAYFATFNPVVPEDIIRYTLYWYSLWSHNRNGQWKGYLQVDLADGEDADAREALEQMGGAGGWS